MIKNDSESIKEEFTAVIFNDACTCRSSESLFYLRHVNTFLAVKTNHYVTDSVTPAKLATLCVYVVNYNGQSTTTVHGFLTCGHILNNCYFILTGQPFSENVIFYTMALRMVLKTTYKAPCITGTGTFKPFQICMCFGIHTICLKSTLV